MLAAIQPRIFVFPSAVKKCKMWNIHAYNFSCGSVWVQNLMVDIEGGT
jgi:methionine salvage enolase-phosphatase E1